MSHARFQKQAREKARREKAAAKRERRDALRSAAVNAEPSPSHVSEQDVLADLAELHRRFSLGKLDFVSFEQRKHELIEQLDI